MTADRTEPPKRITTAQLFARIALVVIVGGAVTAWALTNPNPGDLTDLAGSAPPAVQSNPASPLSPSMNPAAPLAPNTTAKSAPMIANPSPWQYDPVTNQHFDPNHSHWHAGLPPTEQQRAQPAVSNPQPWQYDPATNKYWNPLPGHQHWHDGQPPPPDQRGG